MLTGLALCNEDPRHRDTGGKRRDFSLMTALAKESRLTVLTFVPRNAAGLKEPLDATVLVKPVGLSNRRAAALSAVSGRMMFEYVFNFAHAHSEILRNANRFDYIYLSMPYAAASLNDCEWSRTQPRPILVWDTHNYDPEVWQLRARYERGLRKIAARHQGRCAYNRLMVPAQRCDIVIACTERDLTSWKTYGVKNNLILVPNGVDVSEFDNIVSQPGHPHHFAIFGSLDNRSTALGAQWFLRKVWPLVYQSLTSTSRLSVIGRNPPATLVRSIEKTPGVELVANPARIAPYVSEASCILIPQPFGTGSKLKLLDALATGRPVVCSPSALVGVDPSVGSLVTVVDSANEWIEALTSLMPSDRERGTVQVDAVRERYSWEVAAGRMIEELLAHTGSGKQ